MNPEVIAEKAAIRDAIDALERGRKTIAVIVDSHGRLCGAITDGDIRRAILSGLPLDTPALKVATRSPITAPDGTSDEELVRTLTTKGLEALPIVDSEGCFVRIAFRDDMIQLRGEPGTVTSLWAAVIMAGGEGKRLRPFTLDIPKPMLKVGGVPLMERNVAALAKLGVSRFFVSINYLGHVIEDYFGTGERIGSRIEYLREEKPLGTAGAIRLVPEKPAGPVLVMNGDLLTGLSVERFLSFHGEHGAAITIAAKEYRVDVPFGVLRCEGSLLRSIVEKPSERFLCNAGVYLLSPRVFQNLPSSDQFDMTTLIEHLIDLGEKVAVFPMFEYWQDIGTPEQLLEARSLVEIGTLSQ